MAAIHTAEQPDTVPERSVRLRISPKRVRQIAWVVVFILFALFGLPFDWPALGIASGLTIFSLFYAIYAFGRVERSFADII